MYCSGASSDETDTGLHPVNFLMRWPSWRRLGGVWPINLVRAWKVGRARGQLAQH